MTGKTIYAGVGRRALAQGIDMFIVIGAGMLLAASAGFLSDPAFQLGGVAGVLAGAAFAYFWWLEGLFGVTPGKLLLGIAVRRLDGSLPGLGPALVRTILRLIDELPWFYIFGAYLVWTSPRQQRLGDRLAGTVVVRRSELAALADGSFASIYEP